MATDPSLPSNKNCEDFAIDFAWFPTFLRYFSFFIQQSFKPSNSLHKTNTRKEWGNSVFSLPRTTAEPLETREGFWGPRALEKGWHAILCRNGKFGEQHTSLTSARYLNTVLSNCLTANRNNSDKKNWLTWICEERRMSNHSLFHQERKCFTVWKTIHGFKFEFNNVFSDISLAKDISFKQKFSKIGAQLAEKHSQVITLRTSLSN